MSAMSLSCQTANYVFWDSKLSADITRLGRDTGWKPNENTLLQKNICCYAWSEMEAGQPVQHTSAMMLWRDCVLAGLRRCQGFTIWNHCSKFAIKTAYCSAGCMSNKELKSLCRIKLTAPQTSRTFNPWLRWLQFFLSHMSRISKHYVKISLCSCPMMGHLRNIAHLLFPNPIQT
jgi:hypothetical protein